MTPEIHISSTPQTLAEEAARRFAVLSREAIGTRGRFVVALSGGSTPKTLLRLLALPPYRDTLDWARIHVAWGDERCVPPDDAQSNYRMAREALLAHVPIPDGNVHRMPAENPDHEAAAAEYEATLRALFGGDLPRFDLIHLGLGTEGHTASLFPGSPALEERERWVAAPFVEKLSAHRITLTPPVLNAAREVQFLAAGKDKAAIVRDILHAPRNPTELPAQIVAPTEGRLVWLLDTAASRDLER
jgi:6-phosphogluconolactonase